jgi:DNA-binding LytR/AlgR family response regulator
MKIKLLCKKENYQFLKSFFEDKGYEIDNNSPICFLDEENNDHRNDITVLFNNKKIEKLDYFIEGLKKDNTVKLVSNQIIGRKNESYEIIKYNDIIYFSAYGNTIFCKTLIQRYEVQKKLYEIEEELKASGFIRINKSIVINIQKVGEIIPWFSGKLLLRLKDGKEELEVSRNYVRDFKKYLDF